MSKGGRAVAQYVWNSGDLNNLLVLPGAVAECLPAAGAEQLRVLLRLSSDLSLADTPQKLAKLVGCTTERARAAIAFWQLAKR